MASKGNSIDGATIVGMVLCLAFVVAFFVGVAMSLAPQPNSCRSSPQAVAEGLCEPRSRWGEPAQPEPDHSGEIVIGLGLALAAGVWLGRRWERDKVEPPQDT